MGAGRGRGAEPDLSVGAAFLATGGGADPHIAYFCAEQALKAVGPRCFRFDFDYTPLEQIAVRAAG